MSKLSKTILSELGFTSFIDVKPYSLDEWLKIVFDPPDDVLFCDWSFPTDTHSDEYIRAISTRSEKEVLALIQKFLIPTTSFPGDEDALQRLLDASDERFEEMLSFQYYLRIYRKYLGVIDYPPWEGITWILDVLPYSPKAAIETINAYLHAHFMFLPDGRINGLHDAAELIRAKFIGMPNTREEVIKLLQELDPYGFEVVVEKLFSEMGYKTQLTPPSNDGGRDIIAINENLAQREVLLIECKRYRNPVSVKTVRALLGTVTSEKVTKGIIATSSHFTRGAISFARENPRLELITGDDLIQLLNANFGNRWILRLDRWIQESQKRFIQKG